ncbi:MAG: CopK family periplasmic copper-binding protein [Burkholderiaceae bacterium]|nr:CopK family periplasmic copper-binding protein [Burkholderiaceae bacterium]
MKSNLVALLIAAAVAGVAGPVLAADQAQQTAREVIKLKDGSTLYVFRDGKMAKEDKVGRAVFLKNGEVLDAADGRKLTAVGNEVARLDGLLKIGH